MYKTFWRCDKDLTGFLCPDCVEYPLKGLVESLGHPPLQYDAYVAYCGPDLWFVKNKLIPNLEGTGLRRERSVYRLVIWERDFIVGEDKVEEIVNKIAQSRACIVVLSKNFFKGDLKCYEWTNIVQFKSHSLKVIVLDPLSEINSICEAIPTLQNYMNTRCFLEWNDSLDEKKFWIKLKKFLGQPVY